MSQTLLELVDQVLILAYREPTERLVNFLQDAGTRPEVLRQVHQPEYATYSRSYLCLLNHREAWQRALRSHRPTLILEADFVPVASLATLPPPFDPTDSQLGIAWLYTCAAQIYRVTPGGYGLGYSTAMVAYVITAHSAQLLLNLADQIRQQPGPQTYTPWDSGIEYYLRDCGLHNYVPWRNYGEHGGRPNPEHRQHRLSAAHRADVLYGPLAFAPECGGRVYGRVKGLGRLLLGKYLRWPVLRHSGHPVRLLKFALGRQLTGQL